MITWDNHNDTLNVGIVANDIISADQHKQLNGDTNKILRTLFTVNIDSHTIECAESR